MLGSGLALLEAWSPSGVDALAPDHQREEAHGTYGKARSAPPLQHGTSNSNVLGRGESSLSARPWRINQILQIRSNAFALCGGCHLPSHKTFESKLLACFHQPHASDSGHRPPNLTELMSADRLLMEKICLLVNEEHWHFDDANVRHDMVRNVAHTPKGKPVCSTR